MAKITEFKVQLDGIALSTAQTQRVNQAVQRAVLSEIGNIAPKGGLRWRFPREWLGIWIGRDIDGVRTPTRKTR